MDQTGSDFDGAGFNISLALRLGLILHVGSRRIDCGALRDVVVIADCEVPTGEFEEIAILGVFSRHIADMCLSRAAEGGNAKAERNAVAFSTIGLKLRTGSDGARADRLLTNAEGVVEVLEGGIGRHEAEVVVAAESNGKGVIKILVRRTIDSVGLLGAVVDGINDADEVEVLRLVGGADGVVAIGRGLAFIPGLPNVY